MTDFKTWCTPPTIMPINGHTAAVLVSSDDETGVDAVAATLPEKYAKPETLARIADRLGKPKVSEFLRNKFPVKAGSRSGDLGEILATAYLEEDCGYIVGPSRLIYRDHHEWAMRGDDVLGVKLDADANVHLAKGEAKSREKMTNAVVKEARDGLQRVDGLPSPHSLTQFAERLLDTPDDPLGEAVLELQLSEGVRPEVVTHLMFLFTMNDPSKHVMRDLTTYVGAIQQQTVTLRVNAHQEFIRNAYEKALADGA
ncbi:uncharacterized protein DUF1837 [Kribbella orskensis]|uniref:Uncharacterized protein DUF1837 n=1 Tax=Kribbella orskensis TaxID=2512216 RepID=A0ABY2BGU3_9ACTN|nr:MULTISPECIES: Hachiman antiphage defense system protein HamA [Kribbella]TCN27657.1 uncharacterized protein DUF1837 [Kribbella sp. VKM Ac-2500]TCO19601.1 uncharacterized protein DUF1837 [Kribbella orskensis]